MIEDHDLEEAENAVEKLYKLHNTFEVEGDVEALLSDKKFEDILAGYPGIKDELEECEAAENALRSAEANLDRAIDRVKAKINDELNEAREILEGRQRDRRLDDMIRKEGT